jgi:dTDP-4-amino-4,6-dideoxygalactose transaminase
MDEILALGQRYGLRVIEDCAQAMLSEYKGRPVGTWGDIGCFSLGNKLITMGHPAGMVITNDDALAARGRLFGDIARGGKLPAPFLGNNYVLSDVQAAVGLAQLRKAQGYMERQVRAATLLKSLISDVPGLKWPATPAEAKPNCLFFPLRVDSEFLGVRPADFARALEYEGIPNIYPYDIALYKHPLFLDQKTYGDSGYPFACGPDGKKVDYGAVVCPNTEAMLQDTLFIRMKQSYTERDVQDISAAIRKVVLCYRTAKGSGFRF